MNKKQRLEKLQRKIQEYKNILESNESVQQIGIKAYKRAKAKMALAYFSAITAAVFLTNKALGLGYPIIRDNIKACQEIEKTIDGNGDVTEEKKGYNYYKWGGNAGYSKNNCEPHQEESTKKLYVTTSKSSILEDSNYSLETYDISAMSEEKIVSLLQESMDSFTTYLKDYEVAELEDVQETNQNKTNFEIKINEIDKNDFIWVPETSSRNIGGTCFGFAFSLIGIIAYTISTENIEFIKKYRNNPEFTSNNLCYELLKETQDKHDQLERKLTK